MYTPHYTHIHTHFPRFLTPSPRNIAVYANRFYKIHFRRTTIRITNTRFTLNITVLWCWYIAVKHQYYCGVHNARAPSTFKLFPKLMRQLLSFRMGTACTEIRVVNCIGIITDSPLLHTEYYNTTIYDFRGRNIKKPTQ